MHITQLSTMNFYGRKSTMVKDTVKKLDKEAKFIEEVLRPSDDFVNYAQSAYSVPTGEFPADKIKTQRHPFCSDGNIVANYYLKVKDTIPKTVENKTDFVSESSIIREYIY